ncbi:MAG TPA: GH25 family lysozyme [Nocardioidaceae bacterium]|nr:GH25 family lysozyme [Nocardioidaceae bacterium]
MGLIQAALRRRARSLVVATTAVSALAASALAYADGIDISHWQGTVNWTKVRSDDVTFAFLKATEGTTYADPTLATNWAGAERVGIYRAAYHFARPSAAAGSAQRQARFFVSKAGTFDGKGDLPPVLDLEATGGLGPRALRTWVSTWLTTVEELTGRTPIIYFSPYFWIDNLGNTTAFTRYPLWIAHYTTKQPMVPGGWPTWTFWQRTSSGRVDGISGNVDMNRFNGTSAELAALANSTGGTNEPAPPGPTVPVGAATTLTLEPAATSVPIGAVVTFSGELRTTTPVAEAPDQSVSLWARAVGASRWTKVAEGRTDDAGRYQLSARVRRTSAFQARSAAAERFAPAASEKVRLTTPPRAHVGLDLHKNRAVVRAGSPVMLYGHLTTESTGLAGQVVRYYKRVPGRWVQVRTTRTLAPTGWHSATVRPRRTRVWKVVFPGTDHYAPQRSAVLRVRVR